MVQSASEQTAPAIGHPGGGDADTFEETVVTMAMESFRHSKMDGSLVTEAPVRTLHCDNAPGDRVGLGAEWASGEKKALTFGGDAAWPNYRETKRRLEKWIAEGRR